MGEKTFTGAGESMLQRISALEGQVQLAKTALESCHTKREGHSTYVQSYDEGAVRVALRAIREASLIVSEQVQLLEAITGRSATECWNALKACDGNSDRAIRVLQMDPGSPR